MFWREERSNLLVDRGKEMGGALAPVFHTESLDEMSDSHKSKYNIEYMDVLY